MANNDIRFMAAGAGVRLWQIAERLGIPDSSLSRKLRHELSDEEKAQYRSIITQLSEQQGGEFHVTEKI